jgi:carbon-monoxide dehydrogenase medium subunit
MTPAIEPQEIVTAISLPRWSARHGHAFQEVSRRHGDFAIASAGVLLEAAGGVITRAAIVVGGVDIVPRRLPGAEAALCGQPGTAEAFAKAASHAAALACSGDIHFTPAHRRHVAATLVRRTLAQAHSRLRPLQ